MSQQKTQEEQEVTDMEPREEATVTHHTLEIDGRTLKYTVTAGTMILKEEAEKEGKSEGEKPRATVFYVAYTLEGGQAPADRPLTFSFNGGPGSSSVWLHLGVLGPRRVEMADDTGNLPRPPFRLVDNEFTLLEQTDLVFVDPVSTGYSRAVPGEKPADFHDFKKDIESVGEFIRLFTTRAGRWNSPKYLVGESYGTTRAAGLAGYLQEKVGMYLNGIMLISSILNFQTARFNPGNDLPYILFLPTYAATAHYHEQLPPDLQARPLREFLDEVAFALGEYALALMQGAALPAGERDQIVDKLARYTGLDAAYVERVNLRLEIFRFTKQLLRDQGRTVGRLDSRFTGADRDSAGERFEFDPSYAVILGPYTATFNDYIRRELQFESDLPYQIINERVLPDWKYEPFQNQYVDVADTLRQALNINPYLRILVANGYYDLATPYKATEYTFNHLGLPPGRQDNIRMTFYEAGHMMYAHLPSLAQLHADLAQFVEGAA